MTEFERDLDAMSKEGLEYMSKMGIDTEEINKDLHASINEKSTLGNKGQSKNKMLIMLAAILLALALAYTAFQLINSSNESHSPLVAAYYQAPPFMENNVERGRTDQENNTKKLSQLYNNKNYSQVLNTLSNTKDDKLLIYKGIAEIETGAYTTAISTLQGIQNPDYTDMSQWYLSLVYLQLNDLTNAKVLLNKIAASKDHYKSTQAKDLLSKME